MEHGALEIYVLASLIQSNHQMAYRLRPEDFTKESHRKLFSLIVDRLDKGQKVDSGILEDPIITATDLVEVSDAIGLTATSDESVLEEKIDELCRLSDMRFLLDKSKRLSQSLESGRVQSVSVAMDFLTNLSDDLAMRHPKELDVSLGSSVLSALKRIERAKGEQKIKTGIDSIDRFLHGGIKLGEYVIIGARTNVGKSIWAMLPPIYSRVDSLMCLNEMDSESQSLRMMAHIARVDINAIEGDVPFNPGDGESLAVAHDAMNYIPIKYLDDAYWVEQIELIVKTRHRLNKPIKLVVVDMAGKLSTENTVKLDTKGQLKEVSHRLFRMSKKYHCTVIGTVQINRAGEASEEPQLAHLKDSGSWEEDADKVFLMWSDKTDERKKHIALRKNRTGMKDKKFTVVLDGRHMRFEEESGDY